MKEYPMILNDVKFLFDIIHTDQIPIKVRILDIGYTSAFFPQKKQLIGKTALFWPYDSYVEDLHYWESGAFWLQEPLPGGHTIYTNRCKVVQI